MNNNEFLPSVAVKASLALMKNLMVAMHDVRDAQDKLDRSLQHLYGLFDSMNDNNPQQ